MIVVTDGIKMIIMIITEQQAKMSEHFLADATDVQLIQMLVVQTEVNHVSRI